MSATLPRPARQAGAVLLLLLLVGMTWSIAIWPILSFPFVKRTYLENLTSELARQGSVGAQIPGLQRRMADAKHRLALMQIYWPGADRNQIAAAMQDVIRAAAERSGGQVMSATGAVAPETQDKGLVLIRTRIQGSLLTLQDVLLAIKNARPRLFVDSMDVVALDPSSTREHAQRLSVELGLSGYLAVDAEHISRD